MSVYMVSVHFYLLLHMSFLLASLLFEYLWIIIPSLQWPLYPTQNVPKRVVGARLDRPST